MQRSCCPIFGNMGMTVHNNVCTELHCTFNKKGARAFYAENMAMGNKYFIFSYIKKLGFWQSGKKVTVASHAFKRNLREFLFDIVQVPFAVSKMDDNIGRKTGNCIQHPFRAAVRVGKNSKFQCKITFYF